MNTEVGGCSRTSVFMDSGVRRNDGGNAEIYVLSREKRGEKERLSFAAFPR
jgi:hypothetical protein